MTTEQAAPSAPSMPPNEAQPSAPRRLHRSSTNRVLAGVCGGIAEYYGSDPTAVRVATLIIGLFTGIFPMIILYIVAAIVVPERAGMQVGSDRSTVTPGQTALVLGALLVAVGIAGVANVWFDIDWARIWPLALIFLGAVMVVLTTRVQRGHGTASDRRQS